MSRDLATSVLIRFMIVAVFYGFCFVLSSAVGVWILLLALPVAVWAFLPIWCVTKNLIYSANGGVSPWKGKSRRQIAWEFLKGYANIKVLLAFIPFWYAGESIVRDARIGWLNRKSRPLSYHFKKLKPEVSWENEVLTLTSRGVVGFLTVVSWFVFFIIGDLVLNFKGVGLFWFCSILSTGIFVALILLYVRRRIRGQVIKNIPKPLWGKKSFICKSVVLGGFIIGVFSVAGWWVGIPIALLLVAISYFRWVHGRGFDATKW